MCSLCIHVQLPFFREFIICQALSFGFYMNYLFFNPHKKSQRDRYYHPGCTGEETEAQINSGKLPRKKVCLKSTAFQVLNRYCYHSSLRLCYYSKTKTGGGKDLFGLPIPLHSPSLREVRAGTRRQEVK